MGANPETEGRGIFSPTADRVVSGGKTSNSEVPIDKTDIEIMEIFQNLKNIVRFNLKLFYQI